MLKRQTVASSQSERRSGAQPYTGDVRRWPQRLAKLVQDQGLTDLIVFGEGGPYNQGVLSQATRLKALRAQTLGDAEAAARIARRVADEVQDVPAGATGSVALQGVPAGWYALRVTSEQPVAAAAMTSAVASTRSASRTWPPARCCPM